MFDLTTYYGPEQPKWAPFAPQFKPGHQPAVAENIFLFEGVLTPQSCQQVIDDFDHQTVYPVGIDGYSNSLENAGSFRAMGWGVDFAARISKVFERMPIRFHTNGRDLIGEGFTIPAPFEDLRKEFTSDHFRFAIYHRLGSTPWLRFMRYDGGGMHVPHYDASFHSEEESYRTIFSWVLYLNDVPDEQGGGFQFVDDGRADHVKDREPEALTDWRRMAEPHEIISTVQPRAGRLLVFPHWLCHQVQAFIASEACPRRYIIRGDLAYGIV